MFIINYTKLFVTNLFIFEKRNKLYMNTNKILSNKGKIYYGYLDKLPAKERQYYIEENGVWKKKLRYYDKELRKQKRHRQYMDNRDKELEDSRRWRKENPDKVRATFRKHIAKWREANKEKMKYEQHAYAVLREQLLLRSNNKCEFPNCEETKGLHIHHKKYTNNLDDMMVVCMKHHNELHRKY
jgi:hypothetical protein